MRPRASTDINCPKTIWRERDLSGLAAQHELFKVIGEDSLKYTSSVSLVEVPQLSPSLTGPGVPSPPEIGARRSLELTSVRVDGELTLEADTAPART